MFTELQSVMNRLPGGGGPGSASGAVMMLANFFVVAAFGLAFVSIAFGFIQFAVSQGDKDATDKAKTTLTWGAIGMLVALIAYTAKRVLLTTTGLDQVTM